ncbi:hypothetical protein ACFQZO_27895 [Bradyrhizobium sp. GCM10027634]|uniref:hypothetical protein n=1 Tax=unclassified Bradyrhizobium TaxID=2631580 RepID=UPI00188A1E21|nr:MULTISPECIES: hypothetical protein [unclassified Bradyrhizobium]MDN5004678.1 hypothetical protein [Bradyrhizobium sp. WYCCWR 12677]
MANFVTPKYLSAEGIYPALPMQNAQTERAPCSFRDREMPRRHTETSPIFLIKST